MALRSIPDMAMVYRKADQKEGYTFHITRDDEGAPISLYSTAVNCDRFYSNL